jgi:hypothetical protein
MAESGKLPVSPMLAQYLVGLCALQWDAESVSIDVTLGDVVADAITGSGRDVDVMVTVDTPEGVFAFKGYEVKRLFGNESAPVVGGYPGRGSCR